MSWEWGDVPWRRDRAKDNGRGHRNSCRVVEGPALSSPSWHLAPGPRGGSSSRLGQPQIESTKLYARVPLATPPQFTANFASEKALETRMPPQNQYSQSEYAGDRQRKLEEGFCFENTENSLSGTTETRTWDAQTELSGDQLMDTAPGAKKLLKIMQVLFGGTSETRTKETQTHKISDQQTEALWTSFDLFERKVSAGGATESRTKATQTDISSDEPMETGGQNEDYLSGKEIRSKRSIVSKTQGTQTETFADKPMENDTNPGYHFFRTTVLHDGSNENDFQETKDKKIRDQATREKIDELNLELENLMDFDSSHTPALVELLINHVKLQRHVILSSKLYQETTGLSVTESATSEFVPNIKAIPSEDREDEKQQCESQPKVSTQKRVMSLGPGRSSQSSNLWTPSVSRVFPLQTYVVGQAFGSEQQFLNQVEKQLERWEIYLQKEAFAPTPNRLLLLFCPVMSRAGTDISHALEKIPAQVRIILVVMNHVPIENSMVYLDSKGKVQRNTVIHTVDCRFSQRSGLYGTEINTESVLSVAQKIKQEATLPSIKN